MSPLDPVRMFFGGVSPKKLPRKFLALFNKFPMSALTAELAYVAWYDISATYLFTTDDCAILLVCQQSMLEKVKKIGRNLDEQHFDSGHSVFLNITDEKVRV
ncbi:hypothetical protein MMC28_011755, partial [Mycoblastus sanguinarius]|nr:hypothetical protein [Mycoblastus sanguinarius]